ncbi:MAG TPA: hypothetical protein DEQ32_13275, partial [Gammaproteobacteria bacterium]|nr:hypothetical protein [Gammaproteobacteria bacterium]
ARFRDPTPDSSPDSSPDPVTGQRIPPSNQSTSRETGTGRVRAFKSRQDTDDLLAGAADLVSPPPEAGGVQSDSDAGTASETGDAVVAGTPGAETQAQRTQNIDRIQDLTFDPQGVAGTKSWLNPLGVGPRSGWLNFRDPENRARSERSKWTRRQQRRDNRDWSTYVGSQPGPGNRDPLQEAYVQKVFEVHCTVNIHKKKGGNRDQTLTDIRGIPGVTIVSILPGTSRELPHAFITTLSIKFELNRKIPPANYLKDTLLPGLNSIPGVSNFMFKGLTAISSTEEEM